MNLSRAHPGAMRAGRWRVLASALLLLALLACDKPAAPAAGVLAQGQPFPPAVLDFIASPDAGTRSWQGKLLVLNVWATWCPPCRREMPDLQRLSKTLDPQRFAVIGLSIDQDTLLAQEFLLQYGITFANFFDQGGSVLRPLNLPAYPQTFVIAPDRTLLHSVSGLREWGSPEMVNWLEGLYQSAQRASGQGAR